jgi:hypothetical protein
MSFFKSGSPLARRQKRSGPSPDTTDTEKFNGERQIGWKVVLTAKAIQEQFGFHEPVFGCVLETPPRQRIRARIADPAGVRMRTLHAPRP